MKLTINHFHHYRYPEVQAMIQAMEDMRREVAETKGISASIKVAFAIQQANLADLSGRINELLQNSVDLEVARAELTAIKTEISGLATELSNDQDALVAAVLANPAAPGPVPEPEPEPEPVDPDVGPEPGEPVGPPA